MGGSDKIVAIAGNAGPRAGQQIVLFSKSGQWFVHIQDELAAEGIAYVQFFPLGGFAPLQSSTLFAVAEFLKATPLQVGLAWLLQRSPYILLIPGTSKVEHLRENIGAARLQIPPEIIAELDTFVEFK